MTILCARPSAIKRQVECGERSLLQFHYDPETEHPDFALEGQNEPRTRDGDLNARVHEHPQSKLETASRVADLRYAECIVQGMQESNVDSFTRSNSNVRVETISSSQPFSYDKMTARIESRLQDLKATRNTASSHATFMDTLILKEAILRKVVRGVEAELRAFETDDSFPGLSDLLAQKLWLEVHARFLEDELDGGRGLRLVADNLRVPAKFDEHFRRLTEALRQILGSQETQTEIAAFNALVDVYLNAHRHGENSRPALDLAPLRSLREATRRDEFSYADFLKHADIYLERARLELHLRSALKDVRVTALSDGKRVKCDLLTAPLEPDKWYDASVARTWMEEYARSSQFSLADFVRDKMRRYTSIVKKSDRPIFLSMKDIEMLRRRIR